MFVSVGRKLLFEDIIYLFRNTIKTSMSKVNKFRKEGYGGIFFLIAHCFS